MKLAVDLTPITPDGSAGGAIGVAIELLKSIISRKSAEIIVLCAEWNRDYLRDIFGNRVDYKIVLTKEAQARRNIFARVFNKFLIRPLKRMRKTEYQADLLFCPFSAVNFRQWNVPAVSIIHDIQHEFYPQFFTPEELQHRRKFYRNIVKNAEKAICVSEYTRKTFCEYYGYEEDKAVTVYNAIQMRFTEEDKNVLKRLGIEENKYIVFPANFWEHKNHKLLLNAFGMYGKEHVEGKLVLTGNVLGQEEYYGHIIDAMNMKGRVIITGYLSEAELYAILNNAKGLIYPSLFEGFGIPLVEAMQMNKLIASSNLTSLPEVGCDSIYYFNPKKADEIVKGIEFLFTSEMNSEIEAKYKQHLEKYTIETMTQRYLDVFRETISNGALDRSSVTVEGIYGDGWTQQRVCFHVKRHAGDILKISFRVPGYLKEKTRIYIKSGKKKILFPYVRDNLNEVTEIIKNENTDIEFGLSATWTPDNFMQNGDIRQLGVMVENLEILTTEGSEKIDIV